VSAEQAKEGGSVDPLSGGTVRSLTGRTLAGIAALTSIPPSQVHPEEASPT
jgi:hypothetical protein